MNEEIVGEAAGIDGRSDRRTTVSRIMDTVEIKYYGRGGGVYGQDGSRRVCRIVIVTRIG